MTFAHPILGLILGKIYGHTGAFLIGSILPDIDHLVILLKHKQFSFREAYYSMKSEEKYGIRYKTPWTHSALALIVLGSLTTLINQPAGIAFAVGYLLHLLLDAIDTDEKQYFFPVKYKFRGFLPVFSYVELIAAAVLTGVYFLL